MDPRILLSKLTPMKPILCVVRLCKHKVGAAVSDPYLGYATPIALVETRDSLSSFSLSSSANATGATTLGSMVNSVERTALEHHAGAIAFGLPMLTSKSDASPTLPCTVLLERSELIQQRWSVPLRCTIDDRLTLEHARWRKEKEWDMWEEVDLSSDECLHDPSIAAAVALNVWLWQHCGGWRNTFG